MLRGIFDIVSLQNYMQKTQKLTWKLSKNRYGIGMLQIYSTLTRTLAPFKPLSQLEVKIYYCGPTVYNYAHIGNLRAYLFEDFVVRSMRFLGYKVRTTMNITDIDDKTIRDSQRA